MGKLNVKSRTMFIHDNLDILRGINNECIDLIYLDPPFNKNQSFMAVVGTSAEGAGFDDVWGYEDIKDEWVKSIEQDNHKLHSLLSGIRGFGGIQEYCYSVYMAVRLIEMRRILKKTGSIYLHCDQTMSHYLKLIMDCIFGNKYFRNEIIWRYGKMEAAKRNYPKNYDSLLFYSKSTNYTFHQLKAEDSEYKNRWHKYVRNNKILYGDVKHLNDKMMNGRIKKVKNQGGGGGGHI